MSGSGSPPLGSPTATSPRSPELSPNANRTAAAAPGPARMETRERSGSWLGRLGEGRRRSTSIAKESPEAAKSTSPVARVRSGSIATRKDSSLSLDLSGGDNTVPDVLGSLMFSPRADKLEEDFVITTPADVKDAVLINSSGLNHFYKASFRGQTVLQKVIKYRNIDDRVLAAFEKEVAVLSTLSHPNIVRFIGAKATPPDLFIITEWMGRGSLSNILLDLSREISWQQRISWAQDIAHGIDYLHGLRPKIIHRDLRCDNVMVDENNVAKITEFGLSRRKRFAMRASPRGGTDADGLARLRSPDSQPGSPLSPDADASKGKDDDDARQAQRKEDEKYAFVSEGGPAFTAPELIAGRAYTEKVDTFNYGVLVWQLMTRQIPHRGKKPVEIAEAVLGAGLRPAIPDYVPEDVRTLISACWATEEDKRPGFESLVGQVRRIAQLNLDPELPTEDVETSATSEDRRDSMVDEGDKGQVNDYL